MGEPGADVIPTLLSCPQTLLGGIAPDLVLVDVTVNGPEYYERLLRLLLTSWAPPPAVVFTLFGVCHTGLEPRNSKPRAGLQSTRVALALDRSSVTARRLAGRAAAPARF
jgi:hypothetical protein